MVRYKLIDTNNNIVAVKDEAELQYVTYNTEGNLVTFCKNKRFAFGIKLNGRIYALNKEFKNYPVLKTVAIDILEYQKLKELVTDEPLPMAQAEIQIVQTDTSTLQLYRNRKLKELRNECNKKITAGVTVETSVGEEHFELSVEDQLNLQSMRFAILQNNDEQIAFHSKGNVFRYFTKDEAIQILEAVDDFVLYHNSYYNSTRTYLESLADISTINNFKYGDEIPEEYKSQVLKDFIKL